MSGILFGVSSPYAAEAWESAQRAGLRLAACVANRPDLPVPAELPDVVALDALHPDLTALPFLVPLTTPGFRLIATREAAAAGFSEALTLLDPTAIIAESARVGPGSYINAAAIIAAGVRTGCSALINRGASIGHHSVLETFVSVGPGAVTGGGCRIGHGAFLGVGAVLAPEVTVGANAVVGAGAVVIRDVEPGAVVVGNPARAVGTRAGHHGVAVPADAGTLG